MRILLVDDHPMVRAGMRRLLEESIAGCTFGEAGTSAEALESVRLDTWDVVVLDLNLPGRGGLDTLKDMRRLREDVAVLVMTMYAEDQYATRAFRAGAAGYVTKGSPTAELVAAVRKVGSGGKYVSAGMAEQLAANLGAPALGVRHAGLSDRELEVLRKLGAGRTVKEIGAELALSVKTVSTYRTRLLEKMQMRTTAQLVQYAIGAGLVD